MIVELQESRNTGAATAPMAAAMNDSDVQAVVLKLKEMGTACEAGQAASALMPHRAGKDASKKVERAVQWLMEDGFEVLLREQRSQDMVDKTLEARTIAPKVDYSEASTALSAVSVGTMTQPTPYFPLKLFETQYNLLRNSPFDQQPAYCNFRKCTPVLWNYFRQQGGQVGIASAAACCACTLQKGVSFEPSGPAESQLMADVHSDLQSTTGNHFLVMKGTACLWQEIFVTPGKEYSFAAVVAQGGANSVSNDFCASYVEIKPNREMSEHFELLRVHRQDMPLGWAMRSQAVSVVFAESTIHIYLQTSEPALASGPQYECATVVERVGLLSC